jgi:hypothetical protein
LPFNENSSLIDDLAAVVDVYGDAVVNVVIEEV